MFCCLKIEIALKINLIFLLFIGRFLTNNLTLCFLVTSALMKFQEILHPKSELPPDWIPINMPSYVPECN